jgi:phosphoenolpyruvate carboxykinase (ATP)
LPSIGGIPNNIFFLTYDAFGVLPAISKLTKGQAMYHFISGFTSKVAGTEAGVTEPQPAFSACFGAPFLPHHPTVYAEMLGKKMEETEVNVWLINTGLQGGAYGVGKRISLPHTRALITAALEGDLNNVGYRKHSVFGVMLPNSCPNIPREILSPKSMWGSSEKYYKQCNTLSSKFIENFKQFENSANEEIMAGSPVIKEGY